MKESYLALAMLISGSDPDVGQEISLFFDNPQGYFEKYKDELEDDRGIDSLDELQEEPVIVLNDALARKGFVLVLDWKDDLEAYVEPGYLQELNNGALKNSNCIKELQATEPEEYHPLSSLIDDSEIKSAVLDCVSSEGYSFLIIDEGNDSYPIALIKHADRMKALDLGREVSLELVLLPKEIAGESKSRPWWKLW